MILCDSHTHLDHYAPSEIPDILERAEAAQVGGIVCAGTTVDSSRACVELSQGYGAFYAGVGIHPMQAEAPVDDGLYRTLRDLAANSSKVVCISEIGLDFLPESPDRDLQYQVFREQIRLARDLKLPIIFHSRESHPEVLRTLREEKGHEVGGVMHYFQADESTARDAIDSGFYISLARPLLRLPELQDVARKLPLESIVLETDSAPPTLQKAPAQLDRAPTYPGCGGEACGAERYCAGGGSQRDHGQPYQAAEAGHWELILLHEQVHS